MKRISGGVLFLVGGGGRRVFGERKRKERGVSICSKLTRPLLNLFFMETFLFKEQIPTSLVSLIRIE